MRPSDMSKARTEEWGSLRCLAISAQFGYRQPWLINHGKRCNRTRFLYPTPPRCGLRH